MGASFSVLEGHFRVIYEVRVTGQPTVKRSHDFPESATIADVLTHSEAGPGLTPRVRGVATNSAYVVVDYATTLCQLVDKSAESRLYVRFSDVSGQACTAPSGATVLIDVVENGNGTLTFEFSDGSTITVTAGGAQGPAGPQGPPGADGNNGADGNSITGIQDNGDGTITVHITNLGSFTTSDFTGPQGQPGLPGTPGADGQDGEDGTQLISHGFDSQTGQLTLVWDDGTTTQTGDLRGQDGVTPLISQVNTNQDGSITIVWTTGTQVTIPAGPQGPQGDPGQDGQDGADGQGINTDYLLDVVIQQDGSVDFVSFLGVTTTVQLSNTPTTPTNPMTPFGKLYQEADGTVTAVFGIDNTGNSVPYYRPQSVDPNEENVVRVVDIGGNAVNLALTQAPVPFWITPGRHNELFKVTGVDPNAWPIIRWVFRDPSGVLHTTDLSAFTAEQRPWINGSTSFEEVIPGVNEIWLNPAIPARNISKTYTVVLTYSDASNVPQSIPLDLDPNGGSVNALRLIRTGDPDEWYVHSTMPTWFVPSDGSETYHVTIPGDVDFAEWHIHTPDYPTPQVLDIDLSIAEQRPWI